MTTTPPVSASDKRFKCRLRRKHPFLLPSCDAWCLDMASEAGLHIKTQGHSCHSVIAVMPRSVASQVARGSALLDCRSAGLAFRGAAGLLITKTARASDDQVDGSVFVAGGPPRRPISMDWHPGEAQRTSAERLRLPAQRRAPADLSRLRCDDGAGGAQRRWCTRPRLSLS
jgi:hypothetical protein